MISFRIPALVLSGFAIVSASCESAPAAQPPVRETPVEVSDRVSDGLLRNTTLQGVVDAQVTGNVAALRSFLSHRDPLVRARAAFAAASVQSPQLVASLTGLLHDQDPRVRADAAFALGQTGDTSVSGALVLALRKETEVTAQARIIEALGRVGDQNTPTELVSLDPTRASAPAVAMAITRLGIRDIDDPTGIEWVAKHLSAGDPTLRMHASYYFGRVPTSRPWALHAAYVRDALEDYPLDDPAAMHLVLGLGRFHGADGRLLLHRLENASDWRVRANTASALAPLSSDPRVLEGLMAALDDPHPLVAVNAASSLDWSEIIGEEQLDLLQGWLEDNADDVLVSGRLLSVLANRNRGEAVLLAAQNAKSENRTAFIEIIPAVGLVQREDAFRFLRKLVTSEDDQIRGAAIVALSSRWARWRGALDGTTAFRDLFTDVITSAGPQDILPVASVLADPTFESEEVSTQLVDGYHRLVQEHAPAGIVSQYVSIVGATHDAQRASILHSAMTHPHPAVQRAAMEVLSNTGTTNASTANARPPNVKIDWNALAALGTEPEVRFETTQGDFVVRLSAEQAPATVQYFLSVIQHGSLEGRPFHRVLPNFAVQTGAGLEHTDLVSEFTRIPFTRGVIGMANSGKDTEQGEFFITHSMQPHLDGRYTAFGVVVEGIEVIDRLTTRDSITSAQLVGDDLIS